MPRFFAHFTLSGRSEIPRFARNDKRSAESDNVTGFSYHPANFQFPFSSFQFLVWQKNRCVSRRPGSSLKPRS